MKDVHKEGLVGCALVGGLICAGIGLFISLPLYLGGATALLRRGDPGIWVMRGIGPGLFLLGLLLFLGALIYGIREGKKTTGKGALLDPGARVIARYAIDRQGEMITEEWLFDELDGLKFYVKLELSGGLIKEFQCHRQVYGYCGEGMRGSATFNGNWLGGFAPAMGSNVPPAP